MASLDDLLRQLGIGGVTRNRAGQIVTNTNDVVPVATAGLADTLYGAGRGTLAGTAAIGGIPGDINQMYVNKFGALFPNQPAPPTSEQISAAVKRAVPPLNLSRDNTGSVATSLGENIVAPITAPESLLGAARATKGMPVGMSIKEVKQSGLLSDSFNVIKRDASDTFGAGTERIRYIDPKSGGTIEVLSKPDNTASVMSLEVPEQFRGKKIGESLQARALQDFPELQGQVSSKAAAKTAYRLGRRPVGEPNATLDDVFKAIEDNSSVNLVSPEMQKRFTGSIKPVKPLGSIIDDATKSGLKLDLYEKNGVVNLSRIEVPKELRNSGIGSDVMNQIVNYADSTGNKVTLTPSTDFGATSVSRLKDFYKKFGFVENKGKNKDFSTRETMYRNPQE